MIITNTNPPFDPSDPENINWLDVKAWAQAQGDWYGSRRVPIHESQRLVNLWYLYAWLKWSGYEFYAGAAVASIMWFASGYSGGVWGTGRYDTLIEPDPEIYNGWSSRWVFPQTGDPYQVWYKYCSAWPSNYNTLQGSPEAGTTNWHSLTWITNEHLPEGAEIASCPSYGLSQWTPAITTIMRMMQDADEYYTGVGLHNGNWSRWWPDNATLQLFGMDWQTYASDHTLPENQAGTSYHAEWVYNQIVLGYSERMTWSEYKAGQASAEYEDELDKFDHSCFNWLTHYIQASNSDQLNKDLTHRRTVFYQYIKPAFTTWNRNGGASLEDIPAPPGTFFTEGTWNDPINAMYSSVIFGRRNNSVRTILL